VLRQDGFIKMGERVYCGCQPSSSQVSWHMHSQHASAVFFWAPIGLPLLPDNHRLWLACLTAEGRGGHIDLPGMFEGDS
jgi:hypothetical protein